MTDRARGFMTYRGAVSASQCELTAVHLDKREHRACDFPPAIRQPAEAALAVGR
jgi:acyl-CoA thioesterase FadM